MINIQILGFLSIASTIILGWTYMMMRLVIVLFPIASRYSVFVTSIGLLGSGLFIIGMIGANSFPSEIFSRIYLTGAIWLGGVTIAGIVSVCFLIFAYFAGVTYSEAWQFLIFVISVMGLNVWGLYASFVPRITEYSVDIKTPHTWHGKKIIMIADTHYGNIYDTSDAQKLVQEINTLSGDIVIIPGDFFDGPKIDFLGVAEAFKSIKAPYGVLFANGNHEEYRNTREMLEALEKSHITILNNKKIILDGMDFVGITYHQTETQDGLRETLTELNLTKGCPTILLKHKPTLIESLSDFPIDLVVSGHTHRGQMFPFSIIPDIIYGKYAYGLNTLGNLTSITTSGVGSWGPPQRLGTRSEVVVIRIQ